jgi:hypothetical protein
MRLQVLPVRASVSPSRTDRPDRRSRRKQLTSLNTGRRSQSADWDGLHMSESDSGLPSHPVSPMPEPGDPCPGFVAQPDQCWRMVYSRQLQATHCQDNPTWTGRWFSPKGDRWWRVWSCPDPPGRADGVAGVRPSKGSQSVLKWTAASPSCSHDKAMDSPAGTCLTPIPYRHV